MEAAERLRLTAMPQLITLDDAEVKHAIAECKKAVLYSSTIEVLSPHVTLRQLDTPSGGYYFLYDSANQLVLYLVRYKRVEMHSKLELPGGPSACRQVLVWRTSTNPLTTRFAANVFWKHLFPKYKCLVSDTQQTEKGKEFWQYQVNEALDRKLTVKIINTNDWSVIPVESLVQLAELAPNVWGIPEWFRRMVIVIY